MESPLALGLASLFVLIMLPTSEGIYGRFVQIGDIHYDPTYDGLGNSCNMEKPQVERKKYGNYDCDAPLDLVKSAINEVNRRIYETDFVLWAGDTSSHVRSETMLDVESTIEVINATSYLIRDGIPNTPILPMLGNHDYFPKSQLPTHLGLYKRIADIFCPIFDLEEESCSDLEKAGYYSHLIDDKLLLLILNTNLYAKSNLEVKEDDNDPAGQFAWMREKLTSARNNKYMVHVFAHIPPGMQETVLNHIMFKENHNKKFNEIIREYSEIIIGVFSAHTHTDSFRIFYQDGEPVVPLLISPSVTPSRWLGPPRNPALRVIKFHHDTLTGRGHLTDYDQLYLNLKKANDASGTINWEKEYKFTSYEGAENASAKALHSVVTNFRSYANEDFHKYYDRNSVQINKAEDKPSGGVYVCSKKCKEVHICSIENVDVEDYKLCLDNIDSKASVLNGNAVFQVMGLMVVRLLF